MGSGNVYRDTVAQMGKDGWLTLNWPKEFGGQGRTPMDSLIFNDEAAIAGAPVPFLTINSVAPTIMAFGTDEQKKFFLPKIAAGELHFSIGYSEPGAGTDLAALRTTAVRDGDDYVINGQKMWTSLIAYADYVWLAVRTNPEAKKHRGISMLIVPTTADGFSWTPVHTMAGVDTSATYYQDVRVPDLAAWSARRTAAGSSSPTSSTTSASRWCRPSRSSWRSTPSGSGRRTPRTATAGG